MTHTKFSNQTLSNARQKAFENTVEKLSKAFGNDFLISNLISIIEDSQRVLNTYASRMLNLLVVLLPEIGFEDFKPEIIAEVLNNCDSVECLKNNLGLTFKTCENLEVLNLAKSLASLVLKTNNFLKQQQELLDVTLSKHAPRLKTVAGSTIAAKLLRQAGGLKSLALMPASKIQVLGAEKALFRHLTANTKPPKHGFIANHKLLAGFEKKLRGKAARVIAEHISIAARADYFKTSLTPSQVLNDLNKALEKVRVKA
ncbi:hypothetical protein J7L02_02795 [Candidatus Woesearchaeota archaeon]|nr:hypothetical protein [Candidatus Woesearchaeota archaeon]